MTSVEEEPTREIPEEIVDEILLRLPSRSALARAAAASVDLRAAVSSPRFLRRHAALHPSDPGLLLGVFTFSLCERGGGAAFNPTEPPLPAASAARAVAAAADFSFGFLPESDNGATWMVRDYCDGRFLLDRAAAAAGTDATLFTDLAIADPLSRRYALLPPIPSDLATAVVSPLTVFGGRRRSEPFLFPTAAADDDEDAEPSFTVIWTARCPRKVVAFVFSSREGRWRAVPSPDCYVWRRRRSPFSCPIHAVWNRRHYAHGRFYWADCLTNRWLVLDVNAMELSVAEVPSPVGYWEEHVAVVEAPDGKVGVFAHDFYHAGGKAELCYYTIDHDTTPQWQLEKTIELPWPADNSRAFCFRGAANGCLLIEVSDDTTPAFMSGYCTRDVELFKIDVKSFQVERVCRARCAGGTAGEHCWPYFGFPPSLSLPTV